jgi:hypothetical protein
VRRGNRLAKMETRRVLVSRGTLEGAWLSAGMSPAQLDGLRSLVGARVNIDRIPAGFRMDLLLADGALVGVDAYSPDTQQGSGAMRIDGACLADDGVPCARRLMPLPMAESRVYSHRGAAQSGDVLVQRDVPGAVVAAPLAGTVAVAERERGMVAVIRPDGFVVRMEGVRPAVEPGDTVQPGAPLGRLDARGVVVVRAYESEDRTHLSPVSPIERLSIVGGADEELRGVASWWNELHAWLRSERPAVRPLKGKPT